MSGVPGWHHTPETRARIAESARRQAAKRPRLPGLAEMLADAAPGECPFCWPGTPLAVTKRGKPAHTCGEPECETAWMRVYQRDRRAAQRQEARP